VVARILVDFDGTLIEQRLLPHWVLFLLFRSEIGWRGKLRLALSTLVRAPVSVVLALFRRTSPAGVRVAYRVFKNVPADTLGALVDHRATDGSFLIKLNPKVLELLACAVAELGSLAVTAEIVIHSQGAPKLAILTFLARPDVCAALSHAGVRVREENVVANALERNGDIFTGELCTPVLTKFSRLHELADAALFIGDDSDEALLGRAGIQPQRFANWAKASPESLRRKVRDHVDYRSGAGGLASL